MGNSDMKIQQFENGYWYVIYEKMNMTVAICLTKEEAKKKCKENNWEYKLAS